MLRIAADGKDWVVVWGLDPEGRALGDVRSSLRRWGAAVRVGADDATEQRGADVPDAALLGWWFLDRAGIGIPRSFVSVRDVTGGPPVEQGDGLVVVVVADGPASLNPRAPIPEDPRGVALNARLTDWLRSGGAIPDPGECVADEVGWWSRRAWLALAELVRERPAEDSDSWAPFGVGYHCARWTVQSSGHREDPT